MENKISTSHLLVQISDHWMMLNLPLETIIYRITVTFFLKVCTFFCHDDFLFSLLKCSNNFPEVNKKTGPQESPSLCFQT